MKILIVGTVPYNKQSTSRAFESYFSGMDRENLAQIFSNAKTPAKGHCSTLYQITDQRMLKRRFNKDIETGIVFEYNDLPIEWADTALEVDSRTAKMYKFGSKKNSFVYLLRKIIWKNKYWCTDKLDLWLDEFKPDCVFLSFSDDFFIPQIALYVAQRYDIPIVSSIGDDYYFNYSFSLSPTYHIYKFMYRKLIRKVFAHGGSAIYISDKIRDKYNSEFNLNGETVYLTSEIERRDFKEIEAKHLKVTYCGNIRLGRNTSLNDIATALGEINPDYILDIYSNENDKSFYKIFKENPNVRFNGEVPYSEVQRVMKESDILPIVEGFKKEEVSITKYSLSTKVADSLATGANVLAYGSMECGAIDYMKNIDCGPVCSSKNELKSALEKIINDVEYQKRNYLRAKEITERHHNLESSTRTFRNIVHRVIEERKGVTK